LAFREYSVELRVKSRCSMYAAVQDSSCRSYSLHEIATNCRTERASVQTASHHGTMIDIQLNVRRR
jgi:hypothetical protein